MGQAVCGAAVVGLAILTESQICSEGGFFPAKNEKCESRQHFVSDVRFFHTGNSFIESPKLERKAFVVDA